MRTQLDYERLPREYPHRFLASGVDPADWSQVECYFLDLQARPIPSPVEMERWLDDYSELLTAISEAGTIRYIRMTGQTDDAGYRSAYLSFIEQVEPKLKVAVFNLNERYVSSPARKELPGEKYRLLDRKVENSVRLFREENVELEKEERMLTQRYQEVIGAMTVSYDGRERTMQEMAKYLEEPSRPVREEVWRLTQRRLLKDRDELDDIYEKLISLRNRTAVNAGFENFRDYAFLERERFDYTPADCIRFHDAVEREVVPLVREVYLRRRATMGLEELRPWDIIVDPEGRPPLHPFATTEELLRGCRAVFEKVDASFAANFGRMVDLSLLDLESRPGKAPGGYNTELVDVRLPFIFMNSVGRDDDLRTLLHESGHAFHDFEMRDQRLHYLYRSDNMPTEFAEVASMSMELMGGEHVEGVFYPPAETARSRYDHLLMIARLLPWIATIDAFQHWVYTNPGHSREERRRAWVRTQARFDVGAGWVGLEEERASYWHRQLHLFEVPFYYIEYGIAQLGALGVWVRYLKDPEGAVAAYRRALALGGSKPLPELFETAGLRWDFGPDTVGGYARELRRILLP